MATWIKGVWYTYTMGYYSAVRKKETLLFATTWIGLEGIMLSEINQTEDNEYCVVPLMCEICKSTNQISVFFKSNSQKQ